MGNLSITTRIIQKLSDNSGSVIPIAAKDTLSNCAITYIYNKEASKDDGRERAIEEFGTEILWIGGIPFLKKLFDKTVYKLFKADPGLDVRKFKDGATDSVEFVLQKLKDGDAQKAILENAQKNKGLYKGLFVAKFVTATAATLAGLAGLISYKQKTTQKEIEKKYLEKMQSSAPANQDLASIVKKEIKDNQAFSQFNREREGSVNFKGGVGKFLSGFMYNPVQNMSILDGGITSLRLAYGRKGERFEIGFKEFFQIAFIYCLAKPIEKGLEFVSEKVFNRPINTQYQLLSNTELPNLLKEEGLSTTIENFLKKDAQGMLDYVYDNPDSALVKMLKISGEVPTRKGTSTIDSLAYMDTNELKSGVQNIKKLLEGFNSPKVKVDFDKYLSQAKKLKGGAVVANILIGAAAIGILQPMMNIILRKKNNNGQTINPAIANLEREMEQKFA